MGMGGARQEISGRETGDEGRTALPLSDRYATPGTAFQRVWDCTGTLESLSGAREIF